MNALTPAQRIAIAGDKDLHALIASSGDEIRDAMFPAEWALDVVNAVLDAAERVAP